MSGLEFVRRVISEKNRGKPDINRLGTFWLRPAHGRRLSENGAGVD